jgi:hypothetical protein
VICHQAYLLRQWYREGGTCHELVERVHVDPSGNSFAEVNGGTLTLRCRYFESGRAIPKGELDGIAVATPSQGIHHSNAYPDRKIGNFEGEVLYLPIISTNKTNLRRRWEIWDSILSPTDWRIMCELHALK